MGILKREIIQSVINQMPALAIELDSSDFKYMPDSRIRTGVYKATAEAVMEKAAKLDGVDVKECRARYTRGVLTISDRNMRNSTSITLPFEIKMALEGAVAIKSNEARNENETENAKKISEKALSFVKELPAENYKGAPFTFGWITAAFQEEVLLQYMQQEKIPMDEYERMKIWTADIDDVSYRSLYTTQFNAESMYITRKEPGESDSIEVLKKYPINAELKEEINSALQDKLHEIQMVEGKPYQDAASSVLAVLPDVSVNIVQNLEPDEWTTKRGVDSYIARETEKEVIEFMDRQLPHSGHYMETNDLKPEISFDFQYAISPTVNKPKELSTRYCENKGEFSEKQAEIYSSAVERLNRVALFMQSQDKLMKNMCDLEGIKQTISQISEEEIINSGIQECILEHLQRFYSSMEFAAQAEINHGEVGFITEKGDITGISAEGEYVKGEYLFNDEERDSFYISIYEALDRADAYRDETGMVEERRVEEEEFESIA